MYMNSPKTALMCLNDEIGKKLASLRSETVTPYMHVLMIQIKALVSDSGPHNFWSIRLGPNPKLTLTNPTLTLD